MRYTKRQLIQNEARFSEMADMLTAREMQDLLQVDRSTIYRMAESGRLPAFKVGKQWRFAREQVEAWLQTQGHNIPAAVAGGLVPTSDFAKMLPLPLVQLVQDTFADALGVMIVITDIDGHPVTQVSNPCGLFSVVSDIPVALEKCLDQWRDLAQTIDLEPKFTASHLGLLCARAMIRVRTELSGMVFVGGIAPQQWPPPPEQIRYIAESFGVPVEIVTAHISEVYNLKADEKERVLSFVQRIANIVAYAIDERNRLLANEQSGEQ
jgi:excisionase family DNA binding protein